MTTENTHRSPDTMAEDNNKADIRRTNHLLVIGIDWYEHWTPLINAVRDAKAISDLLLHRYDFVEKYTYPLFDQEASKSHILDTLRDFELGQPKALSSTDNLLIYFAGHGTMNPNKTTGYWIPYDAPKDLRNRHLFLSNEEIKESLAHIKAHHIYIISDACFSGSLITRDGGEELYEEFSSRRVFTSGHLEKVLDGAPGSHSPFAAALLDCLRTNSGPLMSLLLESETIRKFIKNVKIQGEKLPEFQRPLGSHLNGLDDKAGQFVFRSLVPKALEEPIKDIQRIESESSPEPMSFAEDENPENYQDVPTDVEELTTWILAKHQNDLNGYREYLNKYPQGRYIKEAKKKIAPIDEAHWKDTIKDYTGLKKYLELFPNGVYAPVANNRLDRKVKEAWQKAKEIDTYESYSEFLTEIPNSRFTEEAQKHKQAEDDALWLYAQKSKDLTIYSKKIPISNRIPLPEMVYVQGGTFQMGSDQSDSEKPIHSVRVQDFWIAKYPLTFPQYDGYCKAFGIDLPSDNNWGRENRPLINISWAEAQAYCKRISEVTRQAYRLPSEAEWEYAARGGLKSQGYRYAGGNDIDQVAWYSENSGKRTQPVGLKAPNELGIYDMSGNVWEWCEDDWYDSYQGAPKDGSAWLDSPRGRNRVSRGGSWLNYAAGSRVTYRNYWYPNNRDGLLGFRPVLASQFIPG